jgi:uncharacterized membrane protein
MSSLSSFIIYPIIGFLYIHLRYWKKEIRDEILQSKYQHSYYDAGADTFWNFLIILGALLGLATIVYVIIGVFKNGVQFLD